MSLILDALNKADNERNHGDTPSLQSKHDGQVSDSHRHAKILYGLVTALCILAVLVLYLLLRSDDTPKQAAPQLPTHSETSPRQNTASSEPSPRYQQMKQETIAKQYAKAPSEPDNSTTTVNEPPQAATSKNIKASPKEAVKTHTLTTKDLASVEKIAAIYEQSKLPEKVKPTPTPAPKAKPKAPTLADFPLLAYIGDVPYSQQKLIPTIMYSDHQYSPGGASSVTLNKSTYSKGQQIGSQLFLEEIVEDGIVVRHRTLRFKMMAFNSWINM